MEKFGAGKLFGYLQLSRCSFGGILCVFGLSAKLIADMFQSEGFETDLHWDYCSLVLISRATYVSSLSAW